MLFSKVCIACNQDKALSEFTLKRGKPNAQCKTCKYAKDQFYREQNKDKTSKRNTKYWEQVKGTEKQKENNSKKCQTYRKQHPEKFRHYTSFRRALKLKATPQWANLKQIEQIYLKCPEGFEVDHVIPLNHDLVCGLHVESNLQYLTIEENRRKSNNFYITYIKE